ncbi:MAG: symmetrical bis(5'-nucleosyl)-tetraphosphatase [Myxococcota bacterium]
MATYAIGDLQGCYDTFQRLLERIRFEPDRDEIWLAGDLVNRGPGSLSVLRWVKQHEASCRVVLGNHDLHLLARARGLEGRRRRDTLEGVLQANDRDDLIEWLRQQPLLQRDGNRVMVHAGLLPRWTLDEAEARALRAQKFLQSDELDRLLRRSSPDFQMNPELAEVRETVAVMTRVRMLAMDGTPRFAHKGPPEGAPPGQQAWYAAQHDRSDDAVVLFGHWAALGYRAINGVVALDSGCVWGQSLTALRLDDHQVFHQPNAESKDAIDTEME